MSASGRISPAIWPTSRRSVCFDKFSKVCVIKLLRSFDIPIIGGCQQVRINEQGWN
ncbi:MAG: hypothetical protein V7606_3721, partial [Burkholderiales bacterium]